MLKNPGLYPGKHLLPAPRNTPALKPLEPLAQAMIIWRAMTQYVQEKLENGKNVNVRGFGAFAFDISTGLPKIATRAKSMEKTLEHQRLERKHVHKIRLVFVPDAKLKAVLSNYHEKDQLNKPKSQASIYQKSFASIFCNPAPIAAACFLGKDVVDSTLNAIFSAVADLTGYGYSIDLRFGFANISIANKDLRVRFRPDFCQTLNGTDFETKMRQSDMRTSEFWSQSYSQKWAQSSLSKLMQRRPHSSVVRVLAEKTEALKLMSLDLASNGILLKKINTNPYSNY
eukprot:TRINITY_DN1787_c0_g1_i1.p1 TRINITY_DN1787_c0_g1~~TRINITY_DN1787_c0_g1_i1.p1  ORF type:complete len:285 (+),score=80.78 TRINITY_DN1787_c0_g1_i1:217-1071(+)